MTDKLLEESHGDIAASSRSDGRLETRDATRATVNSHPSTLDTHPSTLDPRLVKPQAGHWRPQTRRRIVPWKLELRPWPFWSQLNDPMPPGMPLTNAENDCGPESVAMCLRFLTGVELPADFIKDVMRGEGYAGYTDMSDIAGYFERYTETRTETIFCSSAANLAWHEWRFLRQGKPLIGLFSFSSPGAGDGHFRPVIGQTHSFCITADPWTGRRRVETVADHWAWSKGLLIGIHRKRRLGDR